MIKKDNSLTWTGQLITEEGTKQFFKRPNGKQGIRSAMSPTGKREDGQISPFMRNKAAVQAYKVLRMGTRTSKAHPLTKLWENKKRLYDTFKSANMTDKMPTIALTKKQYEMGMCVVGPYKISHGTLASIGIKDGISDIALGELEIDEQTTVGELSRAVIENNEGWREEDRIEFVVMWQEAGLKASASRDWVMLDSGSDEKLWEVADRRWLMSSNGFLATDLNRVTCGYSWVHVGERNKKECVSSQKLCVEGNQVVLNYATSEAQWQQVADDYRERGKEKDKRRGKKAEKGRLADEDMERLAERIKQAVKEGVLEAMREMGKWEM